MLPPNVVNNVTSNVLNVLFTTIVILVLKTESKLMLQLVHVHQVLMKTMNQNVHHVLTNVLPVLTSKSVLLVKLTDLMLQLVTVLMDSMKWLNNVMNVIADVKLVKMPPNV